MGHSSYCVKGRQCVKILQKNSLIVAEWMVYTDMTNNSVGEVYKSPKAQDILNVFKTLIHCLKI